MGKKKRSPPFVLRLICSDCTVFGALFESGDYILSHILMATTGIKIPVASVKNTLQTSFSIFARARSAKRNDAAMEDKYNRNKIAPQDPLVSLLFFRAIRRPIIKNTGVPRNIMAIPPLECYLIYIASMLLGL